MLLTVFAHFTRFASAVSAEEAEVAVPAVEVLPEWAVVLQEDKVLPWIVRTQSVTFCERGILMRC
jgi:hypothetical protein